MVRARVALVLVAVPLVEALSGCGGRSGSLSPPPPDNLTLSWSSFDQLAVSWTPPPVAVDRYVAEGRIGSGPFELIADDIPPNAIGGVVTLDPATPELVVIGVRMRSVRGGLSSENTPEATLLRGLRQASELVVHAQVEDVALSWVQGSRAADAVLVERAVWDDAGAQLGPYELAATLPGSATSWLDTTTTAPGILYGYRVTNVATYEGTPVRSEAVEQRADGRTSLSPPADLQAAAAPDGVRLTWTRTSRIGTGHRVERSAATEDSFTPLATLDAAATTYLDPAPAAGAYRYRVSVLAGATSFVGASSEVTAFVAPPPGPWGLQQEVLHVPFADGTARGDDGAWWFARHWTAGSVPADTGVWTPTDGGWDVHRLGGVGGEYLVEPGLLLDAAGRPHVLWLLNVDPTPTTAPRRELRHAWMEGATWRDEPIAQRVFSSDNLGFRAQLALDGTGALHVLWEATELSGSTMLTLREYATNTGGSWSVVPLPFTLVDPTRSNAFRLATAPDGSVHVIVIGFLQATSEPGIVHSRRLAGGSWEEEVVPTGPLSFRETVRLVARGADDVDLLYTRQPSGLLPTEYRFQARTAAGWGSPEVLGEAFSGSGHLLPSLAVSPDRTRRAALLELTDGLALATWEAGVGWASGRIHPTVPFDVPWLGFDAQGILHVLVPGGAGGADGFVDRVHLRSTR